MHKSERHQALADFLRRRRAHLAPSEVGLPPGSRRRTPGLRREEVAQLANIGTSWYVWLEQGRDVHPSTQVLESLAHALRLTVNERRHLFLLAGQALPAPAHPPEECVSPALQQLLDDLNPTPACVIGRRWDYLAWNKAADAVFAIADASPPHARNVIWHFFTNPTARERFAHWEHMARGILAELRTADARYPGDAWFEELIEDLKQASPECARWWPQHEASNSLDAAKIIEHPALGHLEFRHLTLHVFNNPDIRVTAHLPDAQTRAKLQRFRTPEEGMCREAGKSCLDIEASTRARAMRPAPSFPAVDRVLLCGVEVETEDMGASYAVCSSCRVGRRRCTSGRGARCHWVPRRRTLFPWIGYPFHEQRTTHSPTSRDEQPLE